MAPSAGFYSKSYKFAKSVGIPLGQGLSQQPASFCKLTGTVSWERGNLRLYFKRIYDFRLGNTTGSRETSDNLAGGWGGGGGATGSVEIHCKTRFWVCPPASTHPTPHPRPRYVRLVLRGGKETLNILFCDPFPLVTL